jgi:hypothetical protein
MVVVITRAKVGASRDDVRMSRDLPRTYDGIKALAGQGARAGHAEPRVSWRESHAYGKELAFEEHLEMRDNILTR